MKKILLLILVFFAFQVSDLVAQENKSSLINAKVKPGSWLVGGNISGSYSRLDRNFPNGTDANGHRWNINARLKDGYFLFQDFAIGIHGILDYSRISADSLGVDSRTTTLMTGPFIRYYLDNGIFGEVSYAAGLVNKKTVGFRENMYEFVGTVGYAYFFNEKVAIEPYFSLRYYRLNSDSVNDIYQQNEFGPVVGIGIQAYLYRERAVTILRN